MLIRSCFVLSALSACSAVGQVTRVPFIAGLDRPVFLTGAPGEPDKLFVLEQEGAIRIIENGVLLPAPFLDIGGTVIGGDSGGDERGLLGLAFAPDYETSGRFFVNYTGTDAVLGLATFVREYRRDDTDATGNTASPVGETPILVIDQPFTNHNGGWIGFGQDGYLYVATGDGGSGNDPGNRAANLNERLGKILRVDVTTPGVLGIPASNPFVGVAGLDEIWAYGLRNPWRTSFDLETGDLWIADVGQFDREEINFQSVASTGGEHYGWRCREGLIQNPAFPGCTPVPNPFKDPVHDYSHTGGRCSITGGYLYRGCAVPEIDGQYIFGDYCTGEVFALNPSTLVRTPLFTIGFGLSSFGEGPDGELFVMDIDAGTIGRIVSAAAMDSDGDGIVDTCEVVCLADVNGDGMLSPADFSSWVSAFNAQAPECDQNGDTLCTAADFSAWIANFNAGCP
jgi:hypothetical protein